MAKKNATKYKKHSINKRLLSRKKNGGKCSCNASFFNGGEKKKRKSRTTRITRKRMTGGFAPVLLGTPFASTNPVTSVLSGQPATNGSNLPTVGPV